jgi:hypothetical protein
MTPSVRQSSLSTLSWVEALPIACTLDEKAFREREAELAELGRSLIAVDADGAPARLTFPVTQRQALESFIVAESSCCPFFEFELIDRDDQVELTVGAPPDGEAVVGELVAAFLSGRG